MRPSRPLVLASVLLITSGGCSFVFVDGPPTAHSKLPYFECTSSNALPTVDLVLAGLIGIGAAAAIDTSSTNDDEAAIAAVEAALFAASAIHGFTKTSSCRSAKAELMGRLQNAPAQPMPGFAPSAPPNDPWLSPPPGMFAPPPTPTPAPTPPSPNGGAPTPPNGGAPTPSAAPPPAADEETPDSPPR